MISTTAGVINDKKAANGKLRLNVVLSQVVRTDFV